jgi:hypothetical protein
MAPWWAKITYASGGATETAGFGQATAYASAGWDKAELYDSVGNDTATLWWNRATVAAGGSINEVRGFDSVAAFGWGGGFDQASFYDSPGHDAFAAWINRAILSSQDFANYVAGYDTMQAFATSGGWDVATLFDSPGDDVFESAPTRSALHYHNGATSSAQGFERVFAEASAGGFDQANMADAKGHGHVMARDEEMSISGAGFQNVARGFDQLNVLLTGRGRDTYDLGATDYLFHMIGQDANGAWTAPYSSRPAPSELGRGLVARFGRAVVVAR